MTPKNLNNKVASFTVHIHGATQAQQVGVQTPLHLSQPLCCCVLGQETSPALPAGGGHRAQMAASPLSVCSRAYHHQCVNVSMTDCSIKSF